MEAAARVCTGFVLYIREQAGLGGSRRHVCAASVSLVPHSGGLKGQQLTYGASQNVLSRLFIKAISRAGN